MSTSPPNFLGNLTGVSFRKPAEKEVCYSMPPGHELKLVREPDNSHDENAVQVFCAVNRNPTVDEWYGEGASFLDDAEEGRRLTTVVAEDVLVGYIERGVAASLARWMDEGWIYTARTKSRIDHKMTPWLLEIEPTGEQVEPAIFTESEGQDVAHDDDIPF